jgi:hypothetical protein
VDANEGHGALVPEELGERRRADDIGEENGADPRIAIVVRAAGDDDGACRVHWAVAEERFDELGLDLDDLLRDQSVRFAVHPVRRLRVGRVTEGRRLSRGFR